MQETKSISSNTEKLLNSGDFFIGVPASGDMGDKFALITLICRLTQELRAKKPDITIRQVILACVGRDVSITSDAAQNINALETVCAWWSYGCKTFPDLGIPVKEMSRKIKELYINFLPF